MLKRRVAAGAAAAMVLTGLGATTAAPAFAGSTKCEGTVRAAETVLVHVTDDGRPPDEASPAPPRNGAERDKDIVVGQLQKGKKACVTGKFARGMDYKVGGGCSNGESDEWAPIRFKEQTGWVPALCLEAP
jgi:hypothetical protein